MKRKDFIEKRFEEEDGTSWSELDCKLFIHLHNSLKNSGYYDKRDKRIMDELRESVSRLENKK